MRTFHLHRVEDESGVSGVGVVAEGVEFTNGRVVISWLTKHRSTTIYDCIKEMEAIHGHGGKTVIVYTDEDKENVATTAATGPSLIVESK